MSQTPLIVTRDPVDKAVERLTNRVKVGTQLHRIDCPYPECDGYARVALRPVGFAQVAVDKPTDPRQCELCKRWFTLRCQIRLTGKALKEART